MRRSKLLALRQKGKRKHLLSVRPKDYHRRPKHLEEEVATSSIANVKNSHSTQVPLHQDARKLNESVAVSDRENTNLQILNEESRPVKPKKRKFKRPHVITKKTVSRNLETPKKSYFKIVYAKRSRKKHKTWEDGFLVLKNNTVEMRSETNKCITKRVASGLNALSIGSQFPCGNWEIEIMNTISEDEFLSGRVFIDATDAEETAAPCKLTRRPMKLKKKREIASKQARTLDLSNCGSRAKRKRRTRCSTYNPKEPGAFILNRGKYLENEDGCYDGEVPVVVDPSLARYLRPHQKEGVQFMYNALVGGATNGHGCILADSMGLGKTLQAICLVWTLLKSGPKGTPCCKKAIIICPATLVGNWKDEFKASQTKILWIQTTRHANQITTKLCGKKTVLICDEGHRLKNSKGNKTIQSLASLQCAMKVILSGTPVQNNLMEFYSMCDFVNPMSLGPPATFRNSYHIPISRSRDATCSEEDKKTGEARSIALTKITAKFVLRRTADILQKFLPPKIEQVVFIPMTELQIDIYNAFLRSNVFNRGGKSASALQCITIMKKICNHPQLIYQFCKARSEKENCDPHIRHAFKRYPTDLSDEVDKKLSGKVLFLDELLLQIMKRSKDKVVIVSNYKETLELIERLCFSRGYGRIRLDGQTKSSIRMDLVDQFNSQYCDKRIFLLSAKAGGVGLNLIGASRLILFDPDWNPATDLQAMARVWRDGQKKTTWIYRLLAVGTIDEKIFQRQISKQEISSSVVDEEKDVMRNFKTDDIKKLFSLNINTKCETYDFIQSARKKRQMDLKNDWEFLQGKKSEEDIMMQSISDDLVSFIFWRKSAPDVTESSMTLSPRHNSVTSTDAEISPAREEDSNILQVDDNLFASEDEDYL
eukprot:jgi/Bigna1/144355/aug1.86_g19063